MATQSVHQESLGYVMTRRVKASEAIPAHGTVAVATSDITGNTVEAADADDDALFAGISLQSTAAAAGDWIDIAVPIRGSVVTVASATDVTGANAGETVTLGAGGVVVDGDTDPIGIALTTESGGTAQVMLY